MSGSFAGLSTALSSLMAQRRAIEVTGQNIANSATPGYVRQRAELTPLPGPTGPAMYARWDGTGGGVDVATVQRLNDAFLDARARSEASRAASTSTEASAAAALEGLLREPGDEGLTALLADMWDGWHAVANNPADLAARTQVITRSQTLANAIGDLSRGIDAQWGAHRDSADSLAQQATTAAAGVAELNARIRQALAVGAEPNDLMDERDRVAASLAELVGGTVTAREDGTVDIAVGGSTLVQGVRSGVLAVAGTRDASAAGAGAVTATVDGRPVTIDGGRLDGTFTTLNSTLPGARAAVDALAAGLAGAVNSLHRTGTGLPPTSATGLDFFSGTTAQTLTVSLTRAEDLAAAAPGEGALAGGGADAIARLQTAAAGPDAAWRTTVADLGVRVAGAQRRDQVQQAVAAQATAARESASGVSIDEEMTNLVAFQRAYEGAGRVLTAVDEMLDVLINRTGLVGR